MTRKLFMAAAALLAGPLLGTAPAWAGPCVTGTVASYSGVSCNVGPVTFSNIVINTTTSGSGSVTLGNLSPITFVNAGVTEYGLSLNYSSATGTTANSSADIAWTYSVAGVPDLVDAYASLAGTTTGTGTANVGETLSNGVVLTLNGPGVKTATFAPVADLSVIKDQQDFSGSDGSASTSILQNAFSVTSTPVPEPASLTLFGTMLLGLGLFGLRKRA